MNTDTQVATPTPDPHAATGSPTTTPPATRQRPRTRRERGRPEFHPTTTVYQTSNPEAKPNEENVVPEDTVRLDYEFLLRGGREEVVHIKSQLVLPLALEPENLAQTDVSFPELFDQVIVRPLVTKFRAFLQRRFDAASRADTTKETAPEPSPSPHGNGAVQSSSSRRYAMPAIDPTPPFIMPAHKMLQTLRKDGE